MGNPFSSVYHKRKKKVLNLKSHCKEWLATGVIGCIFFSKITIIIISALVVYKKPCPHGTKRRSKSTKCKPSCQNSGADWLQKWRHGTYAGAVPAHWQSRWVPVRWHASSTQAAAISAGGLQQRSLHSTATRRLRWSSLPMRCLSSSRYHGIFFWRHVNSSQQINVPIKGKKDAEFSFVHILGRARAVGNECRVESATQIRDLLRTGDYVSTCVHARTKYASRMAWYSAGECRWCRSREPAATACWPT